VRATKVRATAPTYRIFATREGLVGHRTANGHRIVKRDRFVALPSWSVLNDRGEHDYQVRITYNGRSVVAPVWDVGPWNTRDDYWAAQRGMWRDLPRGLPQAQAAYLQGYNGGRDERGRRVRQPNGIDIADGTFWDDLGMKDNGWVEVTFLWLGDETARPAEPAPPPAQGGAAPPAGDRTPPTAQIVAATVLRSGHYFLRWSGKDDASGVASYDLQVRHGSGDWAVWLAQEDAREGLYKARRGWEAPSFRVRARDRAGNIGEYSEAIGSRRP
jgi:hypothetical protein